jgi:hypothetical protein
MKLFSTIAVSLVVLAWSSACQAGVMGYAAADDDGAIVNCTGTWTENPLWTPGSELDAGTMAIVGDQVWGPGHIGTEELDDTARFVIDQDPTVKVSTAIENDTAFAWTGYNVNVYMNQSFTLSLPTIGPDTSETGWSVVGLGAYPVTSTWNGSQWGASVDFVGGNAIPVGGTLDFSYKLTFTGTVKYCQEMTPVPEPSTFALLACGLTGLLFVRRKFAR